MSIVKSDLQINLNCIERIHAGERKIFLEILVVDFLLKKMSIKTLDYIQGMYVYKTSYVQGSPFYHLLKSPFNKCLENTILWFKTFVTLITFTDKFVRYHTHLQ